MLQTNAPGMSGYNPFKWLSHALCMIMMHGQPGQDPLSARGQVAVGGLLMVLIIWGRLPSGMWAAWVGIQDSGHSDPTGGRLQGARRRGVGKRTASINQSTSQGTQWGDLKLPAEGWGMFEERNKASASTERSQRKWGVL